MRNIDKLILLIPYFNRRIEHSNQYIMDRLNDQLSTVTLPAHAPRVKYMYCKRGSLVYMHTCIQWNNYSSK